MSHAGDRSPGASLGHLDATMVGIEARIGAVEADVNDGMMNPLRG